LYDLELNRIRDEILKSKAKNVMLQLPDGMRTFAFQITKFLQVGTSANIILSGDSCYGACDLASNQAKEVNADLLIHYGHSRMVKDFEVPTIYLHAKIDINVNEIIGATIPKIIDWKNVGIVTTIQHVHQVKELVEALKSHGFRPFLGKGNEKTPFNGQILGCHYETAKDVMENVDGFLYIGGGQFHPKGLMLLTGKPVVIVNPYNASVTNFTEFNLRSLAKKRMAKISLAKKATIVGIIVSSKPGQRRLAIAHDIMKRFQKKGYQSLIIYLNEVRPEHLNNFSEFQAFVNTACPRITIDGISGVNRPIISVKEAKVLLEEIRWEDIWSNGYL
jgi:2-(3-amino-3-carboxypropyl)histidine synthase